MANEATFSGSMSFSKGGVATSFSRPGQTQTVAGAKISDVVQNVGTSEEAINKGDVGTPGRCMIENLDLTNFVTVRAASGAADLIKILAGKTAGPFMLAASAPYIIANTAACNVRILIVEA